MKFIFVFFWSFDLLSYCYEIFTCADISFWMIWFRGGIYVTSVTRNKISFISRWPPRHNTCLEFDVHLRVFHLNSYKKIKISNWRYFISPEMKSHVNTLSAVETKNYTNESCQSKSYRSKKNIQFLKHASQRDG